MTNEQIEQKKQLLAEKLKEMKTIYDGGKDESAKMRDAKLQEIEEAYQRYLEKHPDNGSDGDDNPGYNVVTGMRMGE